MGDAISEFTALIDGTGSLRRTMAGHAAREAELFEHFCHAGFIFRDVRIEFAVGTIQIIIGDIEVSAVTRTGKKDQIQIITLDRSVQMDKNKILSRNGSPVSDDLLFDHIPGKRLPEKRVLEQVQLAG